MATFLEELLPRLHPDLRFLCVRHQGKNDLLQSMPRKLRGWNVPGDHFCVLIDNDGGDCRMLKAKLKEMCSQCGRSNTVIRIVVQELEAWFLGAPKALATAYTDENLEHLLRRKPYRNPDAVTKPSERLRKLVPRYQKIDGARRLGAVMERESASASYRAFLAALERMARELGA